MDYKDHIVSDSKIMLGKPLIKGTRITVELILKKLSEGETVDGLIAAYPALTSVSVAAALAYASDVIANETLIPAA